MDYFYTGLILMGSFLFLHQPWTGTCRPLVDVLKFHKYGAVSFDFHAPL